MVITPIDEKQYAENWKLESEHLHQSGIYELLAELTPLGNTLELGCGTGNSTFALSAKRKVLSIEGNIILLELAREKLSCREGSIEILEADFFSLPAEMTDRIAEFQPKVVTGWFIGSSGNNVCIHTTEEDNIQLKSKLYREKVEDLIVSKNICVDTVDAIQLVNRGETVAGFTPEQIFQHVKKDYDTYVFGKIGFEVTDVRVFHWQKHGSSFGYINAPNPVLADGARHPSITSIIAKRVGS